MWTREIPFIDPVAAAARLRALPGLAFLDSAMRHDPLGRHSIVAADPFARFRYRDGRATLDGRPVAGGPMAALRACLEPYRLEPGPEPFPGGAIGYLAYDLGAALERVAAPARRAGLTDDIALNLYDTALVVDHAAGTARLVATGFPETAPDARRARAEARSPASPTCSAARSRRSRPQPGRPNRSRGARTSTAKAMKRLSKKSAHTSAPATSTRPISPSASSPTCRPASTRSPSTGGCARPIRRPSGPTWNRRA